MAYSSPSASPSPAEWPGLAARVVEVETRPTDAHNARAAWSARRSVVLILTDAEGRIGLGEAAPLPGLSAESVEDARTELQRLEHVRCPSARFALDTALLDLRGQREGKPVWALLAAAAPATLECNHLIQTRPDTWAGRIAAIGAGCIKLKIGFPDLDVDAHVAALLELLAGLPAGVRLRLDANGAFSAADAARIRAALEDDRIEYVEDPVFAAALLPTGRVGLAWAADQLLLERPEDVERMGPEQGLAAVIVKPTLHGAVDAMVDLVARARRRDVRVVFTHAFEGAIAHAATVHLAYATAGDRPLAMGLAEHEALRVWPSRLVPTRRPEATGLGLDTAAVVDWLDHHA